MTFLVIVGTVILQGSTAKPIAKLLKVVREDPKGYLIAGANENSRFIAEFLSEHGIYVILADSSKTNIREAQRRGFEVYEGNILGDSVYDDLDLTLIGKLLAITSSAEVNNLALKYFSNEFSEENLYRITSKNELEMKDIDLPRNVIFNGQVDYLNLAQSTRKNPKMRVEDCPDMETFQEIRKKSKGRIIPMFVVDESGNLEIITRDLPTFNRGDKLAYLPAAHS